jgi:hypothetical protein
LNIDVKTAKHDRISRKENKQARMKAYGNESKKHKRIIHYMSGVVKTSSGAGDETDKPLWCFDFFLLLGDVRTIDTKSDGKHHAVEGSSS